MEKEEPGVPEGVKLAAIAYNKYGALHPNRPINQLYQRNILFDATFCVCFVNMNFPILMFHNDF